MWIRLSIFVIALLALPWLGLALSGAEWDNGSGLEVNLPATLLTSFALLAYLLILNHWLKRMQKIAPLNSQPRYFAAVAVASALVGWLLVYLNSFVGSWGNQTAPWPVQLLLFTPLFALLMPAMLLTRNVLALLPGLLKQLAHGPALPAPARETQVMLWVALAAFGLLSGAGWPVLPLFWLAPLLLLVALQHLWHESTVFDTLPQGDWGRVVCGALAGLLVGNITLLAYRYNGGLPDITQPGLAQFGLLLFGWLALQLGDVIAEFWRGTSRQAQIKTKKKFPIPVVVQKDPGQK